MVLLKFWHDLPTTRFEDCCWTLKNCVLCRLEERKFVLFISSMPITCYEDWIVIIKKNVQEKVIATLRSEAGIFLNTSPKRSITKYNACPSHIKQNKTHVLQIKTKALHAMEIFFSWHRLEENSNVNTWH